MNPDNNFESTFPYLKVIDTGSSSQALAVVNLRRHLKHAFPGHSFKVRCEGGSIRLQWVLGPTREEVHDVAARYQTLSLDGSGSRHTEWSRVFGGANCVILQRRLVAAPGVIESALGRIYSGFSKPCHGSVAETALLLIAKTSLPAGAIVTGVSLTDGSPEIKWARD